MTCCHGYVINSTDQSTVTDLSVDDKPLTGNESVLVLLKLTSMVHHTNIIH